MLAETSHGNVVVQGWTISGMQSRWSELGVQSERQIVGDVRHRLMQARHFEGHSKLRAAIRRSFSVRIEDRLPNIEQQLAKD